eukprot:m.128416 g.128416  ORF g.128416 m.128416 type:complete len:168 (+) comp13870_c0_seq1:2043-2546(+)
MFSARVQQTARGVARTLATSTARANQAANPLMEPVAKPPSRIRAVFFGFLAGVTASCGVAYALLTDDIKTSSSALTSSVKALEAEVNQIGSRLAQLDRLDREVSSLEVRCAKRSDIEDIAQRFQKTATHFDSSLEQHKTAVWETQRQLFEALKELNTKAANDNEDSE